MERKYRQRGYMDSARDQREERPQPKPETFGPKTPRLARCILFRDVAAAGQFYPLTSIPGAGARGVVSSCIAASNALTSILPAASSVPSRSSGE